MDLVGRPATGLDAQLATLSRGAGPVTQHPQNTFKVNVSLEPMHPVVRSFWRRLQQPSQRRNEIFRVGSASTVESPGRCQNQSGVVLAGGRPLSDDAVEVLGVLTDQCSTLRCGVSEKFNIGQLRQAWVVGSRHDVVAVLAKPCSRDSRVVHIEDELHPAKRPWRRSHAASSSSAAATFSAISSSISVVKSA